MMLYFMMTSPTHSQIYCEVDQLDNPVSAAYARSKPSRDMPSPRKIPHTVPSFKSRLPQLGIATLFGSQRLSKSRGRRALAVQIGNPAAAACE
jgi:hypothetical protein